VPEVVAHGTTGLLVPPGDSDALRDALEQLACGGVLAEALPALPLKTVGEGARELEDLYAPLVRRRVEAVT
jgi:hypothetical protein